MVLCRLYFRDDVKARTNVFSLSATSLACLLCLLQSSPSNRLPFHGQPPNQSLLLDCSQSFEIPLLILPLRSFCIAGIAFSVTKKPKKGREEGEEERKNARPR